MTSSCDKLAYIPVQLPEYSDIRFNQLDEHNVGTYISVKFKNNFLPIDPDYNISAVAEVFIDVDYKDAKHKVSFYCMIDDKNNIKEEVDEFMSAAIKSSCNDDLFYEQLESNHILTRIQ